MKKAGGTSPLPPHPRMQLCTNACEKKTGRNAHDKKFCKDDKAISIFF